LLCAGLGWGPIQKTAVVRAPAPEEDANGVSATVPEMVAVSAQCERIVVMRVKQQADLLGVWSSW
jgi:hypothetical protein